MCVNDGNKLINHLIPKLEKYVKIQYVKVVGKHA